MSCPYGFSARLTTPDGAPPWHRGPDTCAAVPPPARAEAGVGVGGRGTLGESGPISLTDRYRHGSPFRLLAPRAGPPMGPLAAGGCIGGDSTGRKPCQTAKPPSSAPLNSQTYVARAETCCPIRPHARAVRG